MEAQRQGFQAELERVKRELEVVRLRAKVLEKEIESVKIKKPVQEKRSMLVPKKPITSNESELEEREEASHSLV